MRFRIKEIRMESRRSSRKRNAPSHFGFEAPAEPKAAKPKAAKAKAPAKPRAKKAKEEKPAEEAPANGGAEEKPEAAKPAKKGKSNTLYILAM